MAEKEAGAERGAPRRRGLLGGMALAGIDQALLSALSLGAAALFTHAAPKAEYGVYTLVAGLVLLGTGVHKVADLGASSVRSPARGQEVMRG